MDPDLASTFESAADVLKALDQRFHDYNRVQTAKLKYRNLEQGNTTYDNFRVKFNTYAITGKIARFCWFEDLCEKIAPHLKRGIRTEKYRMNNSYTFLDEFLAIADREERNIRLEESFKPAVAFAPSERSRNILKKDSWRSEAKSTYSVNSTVRSCSPFSAL